MVLMLLARLRELHVVECNNARQSLYRLSATIRNTDGSSAAASQAERAHARSACANVAQCVTTRQNVTVSMLLARLRELHVVECNDASQSLYRLSASIRNTGASSAAASQAERARARSACASRILHSACQQQMLFRIDAAGSCTHTCVVSGTVKAPDGWCWRYLEEHMRS
jgi:hypothetical protein